MDIWVEHKQMRNAQRTLVIKHRKHLKHYQVNNTLLKWIPKTQKANSIPLHSLRAGKSRQYLHIFICIIICDHMLVSKTECQMA